MSEPARLLLAVAADGETMIVVEVFGELARRDVAVRPIVSDFIDVGPHAKPGLLVWEGEASIGEVRYGAGAANGVIWRGALRPVLLAEWRRLQAGEPVWGPR